MIFAAMMRPPEERPLMGFDMTAPARELAWSRLAPKVRRPIGETGSSNVSRVWIVRGDRGVAWQSSTPWTKIAVTAGCAWILAIIG